jgi:hypothetical protein
MEHGCVCANMYIWSVWIYVCGILLMRMLCCEITWGQDNESTGCVTCRSTLLYELVMITRLEHECEFMRMSIWYNVNLWVWKYNIMGMCIKNPFYGNVDLRYPTWIVPC